ncbi:beta-mannosidase [Tengunoibacter tsumagoiensis]|uniref:Beta-mannosidase B n=1 Tax=Tengunoibacter tsumagoiensis TaxID=2014871 RepID=A0A401ZTN5_9CHLR|nr:glycoside hydrolase family 2 protein [Tengunoibacter tsumagoiensis]GCE10245.1 beta-mannosidase [Tengunoibacter tsumagoiensis]
MEQLLLTNGWECKQRSSALPLEKEFTDTGEWLSAQVPGTIHQDLLAAGRIPDPFFGLNEEQVQWIGESDWLYRCTFDVPAEIAGGVEQDLCFDGLDTYATVWLNGQVILHSDNMFIPARVPVRHLLQAEGNELWILFESALLRGKALEAEFGKRTLWNSDSSRLYVRKAQYHYGWDWGPTLLTAGPWQKIRLESYQVRIADLHCPVEVAEDLKTARFPIQLQLEAATSSVEVQVVLALYAPSGEQVAEWQQSLVGCDVHHTFEVAQPELWWPRGYGAQPLYRLVATVQRQGNVLDQQTLSLGARRLRLVQEALQQAPGTSFYFEINTTPIFCGGVNWIPADSFTPGITDERYRKWLQLAADGNLIMLRVWGGGIYESDYFYQTCDELGLLVWQDFMFACGIYPAHEALRESVKQEAEANVRRLRHHPSLVIWAGNNEDYLVAESIPNLDAVLDAEDPLQTPFPARAIYEQLLPAICARLDPARPYWPGSPYGGRRASDPTIGDVHVWSVWHGEMLPYQDYPKLAARFISEFGMASYPAVKTIEEFTVPEERYPQSRTLDGHNKAGGGDWRMASYMIRNIRYATDLVGYTYATQFIQSEALGSALRGWRRLWQGPGCEYTAGALIWQLNDCWPVSSWATVDYAFRPKPAYYTTKRELAPFIIGLAREGLDQATVWVGSSLTTEVAAEIELTTWTLDGKLIAQERWKAPLAPNRSHDEKLLNYRVADQHVISARLLIDGVVMARAALWPEPFKYLNLPDPEIRIERAEGVVRVSSKRPAKGVWLQAGDQVKWSDNMLDVFPDDVQPVVALGLEAEEKIEVRWLGL